MNAYNQESWLEQDNQLRQDELARQREDGYNTTTAVDPDEDDELLDDDDDLDLDDDDEFDDADLDETDTVGDDIDSDDDLDLDDDEDLDADEDLEDDGRIAGDGVGGRDFTAQALEGDGDENANEIPEQGESDNEDLGYPDEQEVSQQQNGNDASFSEQTDVTPPRTHEFPNVGSPETNFESRDQGRTTGRMIGHEPGTEGI